MTLAEVARDPMAFRVRTTLEQLALYRVVRGLIVAFARVFWRMRVEGAHRIPLDGPVVLAPVHRSNVDSLLVSAVTRRRLRMMGKASLWEANRAGAAFLTTLGGFPVRRGSADREALQRCIQLLEAGEAVVIFPEGTRQSGPAVQPLFEGAAYIACRTGAPIVPIGIGGTERAMPKGSKGIRPVRVHLVVGEPIQPPGAGAGGRVPRSGVKELTERLAAEIQALFDRAEQLSLGAGR